MIHRRENLPLHASSPFGFPPIQVSAERLLPKECPYRIPLAAELMFIAESGAALGRVICVT
jgi:hypothetical protein